MVEKKAWAINGYLGIILILALFIGGIALVIQKILVGIPLILLAIILATGVLVVQPNKSYALVFFGSYLGTVREPGLWLSVPLAIRKGVSLRVRNFNSKTLKVNDIEGNPVEIAAVIVFRVIDTAKAIFDVEKYEEFVEIQSETALRHIATRYAYDDFEGKGFSLRGNPDEVSNELMNELQQRLDLAGVEISEARLTHLAYATEIAGAMLQRQQASAILSARQIIVEGAVGMVQMAIARIENDGVVDLDEERKAAMINNLLVSIVSERATQPVINAGTMY
ncbi:membrane protease subunit, stomatin/prohibitin [Desulfosporosinus orientis DSM 765]|uniref:Membrane protease subunit, stomatin/prohibitin n=1 Tax=Desulfosporosinus orientis (strain ATCC 19365 / DSM 765 / NCIMB 8382 / VKM B-1628 / Singapore I) TaxID=768706 RepID=G7WD56_DESOD|nr:SPFH domain-containing protein [Desulfosporosinus orientis]AET67251.1 membrane protease subunit, stomatin/prohibitin [Desulfosporosinus orientis DSM 765]